MPRVQKLSALLLFCALCTLWWCADAKELSRTRGSIHFTALHTASLNGRLEEVRKLLAAGAEIEEKGGPQHTTSLHEAAMYGHEAVARLLLKHGADMTARCNSGGSPLHYAANQGRTALVRILLDNGADISATTDDGRTSLHDAAAERREAVVRLLLEYGADVLAKWGGKSPEDLAVQKSEHRIAAMLRAAAMLTAARPPRGVPGPIQYRRAGVQHALLPRNVQDPGVALNGDVAAYPALCAAASEGRTEEVRVLLVAGADIEERGGPGASTALHHAVSGRHAAMARMLVANGADVSAKGEHGDTPLHRAAQHGLEAVPLLLLDHGAEVSPTDIGGRTPLHEAAYGAAACGTVDAHECCLRYESLTWLLLGRGADVSAKSNEGATPLHIAADAGQEGMVRLLIEHGADVWAKTSRGSSRGMTPLDIASGRSDGASTTIAAMLRAEAQRRAQEGAGRKKQEANRVGVGPTPGPGSKKQEAGRGTDSFALVSGFLFVGWAVNAVTIVQNPGRMIKRL
ncbi:ankyrin repeat-containing domain protein [Baffinella frigidus]|nr:ankyrin repeat-containing domain protein [Cryptophyta sp. CCMP2293]